VDRIEKKEFVTNLRTGVESAELVVLTSPLGLTVGEVSDLRRQMRDAGATFKVVKNTLAKIALEGTKFTALGEQLKGPIALAYSKDPVAAAKVATEFAKGNDKLTVLSGALGEKALSGADVDALAKLPSLDEMRAKMLSVISGPARQLAGVISAPGRQLAQVISAHSRNG
jgi:large subunit ribosomal protein L10